MSTRVCVDPIDCTDHLTGRRRTYRAIKSAVLAAGRFSVFEATQDLRSARWFSRLHCDPELVVTAGPFPWTFVKRWKEKS